MNIKTCPRCGQTVRADTMTFDVTNIPVTSMLNGEQVEFLVDARVHLQDAGVAPLCTSCFVTMVQYGMGNYLKVMMGVK